MKNEVLRDGLVRQAEHSFINLMEQVDVLFDLAGFYLDRYNDGTASAVHKAKELKTTVDNIAESSAQLGETLKRWKTGEERVLSRLGTETSILNELWANIQALIYFIVSHEIDLSDFCAVTAAGSFQSLVRCNRLLT